MESLAPNEGGFSSEGILGYSWTSQSLHPGLAPITRIYDGQANNPWTGDHALMVAADPFHTGENFPYYSVENPLGYGYARYLNTDIDLHAVQGGGVTIKSNAVTGCAVWEWWWNGIQFINDYDYGRQLSASMSPYASEAFLAETGDNYSGQSIPVMARHSSPCLFLSTSGSSQSTLAIPLDWFPAWWGGGSNNPVIYPDVQIGKNITLNWIAPDGVDRNWPVVLYETVVNGVTLDRASVEAPTGYLNGPFKIYYKYDRATQTFSEVYNYEFDNNQRVVGIPVGGPLAVIIATGREPNAIAMGVYTNDSNAGMTLYDRADPEGQTDSPSGQADSRFAKWGVRYDGNIYPNWRFKTWIMTGTLQDVQGYIRQLHAFGVTSR